MLLDTKKKKKTGEQDHDKMPYRVGNIVRKGEIACYKQFLLF